MDIMQLVTGPLCVNTWIIPSGRFDAAVIDPGGDADAIIAHLRRIGRNLSAIILTHGHFDHLIAVPFLKETYPGVPVYIHADDASALGPDALRLHRADFAAMGMEELVDELGRTLPSADYLLRDGDILPAGTADGEWRILHTPGHSPGSLCLYNENEKILIAGDTLFKNGAGRTDLRGGSFFLLQKSLLRLSELPGDVRTLPGHGSSTTIGAELD